MNSNKTTGAGVGTEESRQAELERAFAGFLDRPIPAPIVTIPGLSDLFAAPTKMRYKKLNMMDIMDPSGLDQTLKFIGKYSNELEKVAIAGPEYDAMGYYDDGDAFDDEESETKSVPSAHVERAFKAIATLPTLREIVIDPSYYSDSEGMLDASRVCWLLSKDSAYETLRIGDLSIDNQSDVERLARAFSTATSIKNLCIDKVLIGYFDVTTLAPLMEALAKLPNLTQLRLVFDAFGNDPASLRHAQESLPILKKSTSLVELELGGLDRQSRRYGYRHPELSNCGLSAHI